MSDAPAHGKLYHLARQSLWKWLFWLAWDWAVIIACMVVIVEVHNWIVWVLAILVIGSRQHAIAILGHDGTHRLACKDKRLNDFLTNVFCFLPFGANLNSYRAVHLQHHAHLGTDKDPELDFKREMKTAWDLPTNRTALVIRFCKDLIALGFRDVITVMKSMPVRRVRDYVYLALFWLTVGLVLFMTGYLWVLIVWFTSTFTANWAIFRLRIWSEHVGTSDTHLIRASRGERWVFMPHNTWYHYEHHQWPWIPFYNLPQARSKSGEVKSFSDLLSWYSVYKPL